MFTCKYTVIHSSMQKSRPAPSQTVHMDKLNLKKQSLYRINRNNTKYEMCSEFEDL